MLTEAELLVRARDWADVLWRVVPGDALEATVRRAFADYMRAKDGGTYPLNAYHLKLAYDEIKNQRHFVEASRTLTTDERVSRCPNKANHLPDTFGEIEYFVPNLIDAVVPCGACRTEDFDREKVRLLAGRKEPEFEESIKAANG